jgi:hypothetical protein
MADRNTGLRLKPVRQEPIPRAGFTGRPSSQERRQEPGTENACSQEYRSCPLRRTRPCSRSVHGDAGGDRAELADRPGTNLVNAGADSRPVSLRLSHAWPIKNRVWSNTAPVRPGDLVRAASYDGAPPLR